jgi:hypothetical protein
VKLPRNPRMILDRGIFGGILAFLGREEEVVTTQA